MHLFGLTGGIASGKSTVAAQFRAMGLPVIDADQLARDVVAPGTPGLDAVVRAFGSAVLDGSGALDRKALGVIVFADRGLRETLNAILHPRIAALALARAAELAERGETLAAYEAALLVENGLADAMRPLVVVAAPEALQVARAMARDALTQDEALARVRAQQRLADKIAVADFVIHNGGDLEGLRQSAEDTLRAVRARVAGA